MAIGKTLLSGREIKDGRPWRVSSIPFGDYWHTMFQPSPLLEQALQESKAELGLTSTYDAVHCRVRHPAHELKRGASKVDRQKGLVVADPDKWKLALKTARRALTCSQWLRNDTQLSTVPVFFFSDSAPLVRAIVMNSDANDTVVPRDDPELLESTKELARRYSVVGRYEHDVAHLEEKVHQPIDAYLSSFVDLYMAIGARCITLGVGRFSYMGAQISGTQCLLLHESIPESIYRLWGMGPIQKLVPVCPKDL